MKIVPVPMDDATYEALVEVAGRDLRRPAAFILAVLRKEMRLPFPYEDSPVPENPGLLGAEDPP
jgi:hypothetical protein